MDLKTQILTALGIDKKIMLEWQAKLTDGTIVVSPDTELTGGSEVNILVEDGSQMPVPAGSYETEDGVGFVVADGADGIVSELLTEEAEAPTEETEEVAVEAAEEATIDDWKALEERIKNLEDGIADLKADKEGGDDEAETEEDGGEEEMSTPTPAPRGPKTIKKTEVTEFSKMRAENKRLTSELKKLGKTKGADALNLNKFSTSNTTVTKLSKTEYNKLTAKQKFAYDLYK
tara:strand:+ start:9341 stop:10036 length:696 start_codon:yes stop_codon:yes gene_type:complete